MPRLTQESVVTSLCLDSCSPPGCSGFPSQNASLSDQSVLKQVLLGIETGTNTLFHCPAISLGRVLYPSPIMFTSAQIVVSHCCLVMWPASQLKVNHLLQESMRLCGQLLGHTLYGWPLDAGITICYNAAKVPDGLGMCLPTVGPTLGANFCCGFSPLFARRTQALGPWD